MLKDNRGFSYVEVMTICVILCIIIVISYPVVMVTLRHSKQKLYKESVASIERISLGWALEHISELPDDSKDARFVTLKELEDEEYIKSSDISDPRDNSTMNGCIKIMKSKNEQYEAKYYENTCETIGKKYLPRVKVIQTSKDKYQINDTEKYEYPELKATTVSGEELEIPEPIIKCDGKKVKKLENQKLGTKCEIIYHIKDPNNGLVKTKSFSVSIVDTLAPVITVLGQEKGFTEEITVGEDYKIPKATAMDNSKGKTKIKISTDLNLKRVGEYEIVYTATDESDNLGIFIIKVNVTNNKLLEENQIIVDNASVLPGNGTLEKENASTYIFKGTNPNNYLLYQKELWRIIKLDQNGIKLIKNAAINKITWSGQNSTSYSNSNIKKKLENYQILLTENGLNKTVRWNIGMINPNKILPIESLIKDETSFQSDEENVVGLLQVSDYLKASNREACLTNLTKCNLENYLTRSYRYFTAQSVKDEISVITIGSTGLEKVGVSEIAHIVPTIYLKGYKTLQGTGTINDPYILVYN